MWTGMPQTWVSFCYNRGKEDGVAHQISPFFKNNAKTDGGQDYFGAILSPHDTEIDEAKYNAIKNCLTDVGIEIVRGKIKYNTQDIFKLKPHSRPECNCQIMLYKILQEVKTFVKEKEAESEEDYHKIRNALNEEWEFIQKGKKKR